MGLKDFYLVVNFMCIFLLWWTIFKTAQSGDKQLNNMMFARLLFSTQTVLIFETIWVFAEGSDSFLAYYINCISNILIQTFSAIIGYQWLIYIISGGETKDWLNKKKGFLLFLPTLIVFVMAVASPIKGWLFIIDRKSNSFSYGPLNIAKVLIVYTYFFAASVLIISSLINRSCIHEKSEVIGKICCIAIPVAALVHYLYRPEVPVIWQSITVILLISYSSIIDKTIYADGLTGLNNRKEFNKNMDFVFRNLPPQPDHAYLFMIDIDYFKKINDSFGHVEGDKAIIAAAETLKDAIKDEKAFACRYGGDKFALVFQNLNQYRAQAIQDEIYRAFTLRNELSLTKYALNISIGFAAVIPRVTDNQQNLIKAADKMLYEEKKQHHIKYMNNFLS